MQVSESKLLNAIREHVVMLDEETLAMLAGEVLGGECTYNGETYNFTPGESYLGELEEGKNNS